MINEISEKSTYPVNLNDWILSGHSIKDYNSNNYRIVGIKTGEFREVKAGEWYLSGSLPECYLQPHDTTMKFHIVKLYVVKKITHYKILGEVI